MLAFTYVSLLSLQNVLLHHIDCYGSCKMYCISIFFVVVLVAWRSVEAFQSILKSNIFTPFIRHSTSYNEDEQNEKDASRLLPSLSASSQYSEPVVKSRDALDEDIRIMKSELEDTNGLLATWKEALMNLRAELQQTRNLLESKSNTKPGKCVVTID